MHKYRRRTPLPVDVDSFVFSGKLDVRLPLSTLSLPKETPAPAISP